jgi:hypothetical protein
MAVDTPVFQSSTSSSMHTYAVLPTPGLIVSYPFWKNEDPIDGSMVLELGQPAWLHRTWTCMDWHQNTAVTFYVPMGAASVGCYGSLGGAMPINQFPAGFKLCRYTAHGQTPWDFADTENDGFFRHCQVM